MAGPRWRWNARGAWWRIVVPLAAVVVGLAAAIGCVLAVRAAGAGHDASNAVGVAVGSAGILLVGLVVLRAVQPGQRRLMLASNGRVGPSLAIGLGIGAAIVVGSALIIGTGASLDADAKQRLEEVQVTLAGVWWQTALIVFALIILAPLGEEILFRALELRGLVRLIPFAVAAAMAGLPPATCGRKAKAVARHRARPWQRCAHRGHRGQPDNHATAVGVAEVRAHITA